MAGRWHATLLIALAVIQHSAITANAADNDTCLSPDSPAAGQYGTRVTITGTNLLGKSGGTEVSEVTLAGVKAEILAGSSPTKIVVMAQAAGAGKGDIVVTANSGARTVQQAAWNYLSPGQITSLSPAYGQVGTRVVVVGSNLLGGGSKLVKATLAGVEVKIITAKATSVELEVVSGDAQLGSIVLESETGAIVERNNSWTFEEAGSVTSVTPNHGQHDTKVTIVGKHLFGHGQRVDTVLLAGVKAGIDSQTDTKLVDRKSVV